MRLDMREIAIHFLAVDHNTNWENDPTTADLVDYVYNGGIWVNGARTKYAEVKDKQSSDWCLNDIYTYLTVIILMQRICDGTIDRHVANGTVASLLSRYLELTEEKA